MYKLDMLSVFTRVLFNYIPGNYSVKLLNNDYDNKS